MALKARLATTERLCSGFGRPWAKEILQPRLFYRTCICEEMACPRAATRLAYCSMRPLEKVCGRPQIVCVTCKPSVVNKGGLQKVFLQPGPSILALSIWVRAA